jgi:hypothetical protein
MSRLAGCTPPGPCALGSVLLENVLFCRLKIGPCEDLTHVNRRPAIGGFNGAVGAGAPPNVQVSPSWLAMARAAMATQVCSIHSACKPRFKIYALTPGASEGSHVKNHPYMPHTIR